nr:MAG TPA: hypothetical protein [Caudoviricetes sp.]
MLRTTLGQQLYNNTHTLPIREGFFCVYNGNFLNFPL